jgi:hypothetical protein
MAGVEEVERNGVKFRVYGVDKTAADCFKHRNKIGLDVALEALKDARARTGPCDSASHGGRVRFRCLPVMRTSCGARAAWPNTLGPCAD